MNALRNSSDHAVKMAVALAIGIIVIGALLYMGTKDIGPGKLTPGGVQPFDR